jgi:RNA polymerase sigma factor (TIGR02999 family)
MHELTDILERARNGDIEAAEQLVPLVYDQLKRLAAIKMAQEAPGQTLQPTALVHEAWLRLGGENQPAWQNRAHFFGAAAEAMRRILIERARAKGRIRRGGNCERINLDEVNLAAADTDETVMLMDEALTKLQGEDALKAEIVKLRYFAGMTHNEIGAALGIAEPTVRRQWAFARSWLYAELKKQIG